MSRQTIKLSSITLACALSFIVLSLSKVASAEPAIMQPVEDIHFKELPPPWFSDVGTKTMPSPAVQRPVRSTVKQAPKSTPAKPRMQPQVRKTPTPKVQTVRAKPNLIQSLLAAANRGNMKAQYDLGMRYQYGNGVQKSRSKAHRWLNKSAQLDYARAQYALSLFYQQYARNQQGIKKALLWLKKAADQGLADAQYSLGMMFKNGTLVYQNPAEAKRWLKLAANQGHVAAQLEMKSM